MLKAKELLQLVSELSMTLLENIRVKVKQFMI